MNVAGDPLPMAWIGRNKPFVGVEVLMLCTPLDVSIAPEGNERVIPFKFQDNRLDGDDDEGEDNTGLLSSV